jgi:exoribonuclease-2
MPDKKIPMFPPQISEQLCSLKLGEDRIALSLMVSLDRSGKIRAFEFFESVIRVDRQYTYYEANMILERDEELSLLYVLAKQFREQRLASGALQLILPEIHISINDKRIVTVNRINRESPSRVTVAEFMIMTNWLAGKFLRQKGIPSIYRSQGEPRERLVEGEGGTLFQNWLQRRLISRVVVSTDPDIHTGLGLDAYSSCTSPIRKYLDLVVQRQLKGGIDNSAFTYGKNEIRQLIQLVENPMKGVISVQQRRARYWLLRYLEQIRGQEVEALVVDKGRDRYILLLLDVMIETWLPLSCGLALKPGDTVSVIVDKVSPRLDTLSVSLGSNQGIGA